MGPLPSNSPGDVTVHGQSNRTFTGMLPPSPSPARGGGRGDTPVAPYLWV